MSLHHDLLAQSRFLAEFDPRRPKQVNLRRAVSGAYYALFHLLAYDAAKQIVGTGAAKKATRLALRRGFVHGTMKEVAREFSRGTAPRKMAAALMGEVIPDDLVDVCSAFVELQEARHAADYDVARGFTRDETLDLIGLAEEAFPKWGVVRKTPAAQVCLLSMLALRAIRS